MRSQKSRSRGNKNRNNSRPQGNVMNRVFDSSGPEGKVRGTPQQIIDKYGQLHRDATLSNDRVAAENFAQHAEHYTRMLGEAMREQEARQKAQDAQNQQRQKEREEQQQANQERQRQQGGDNQPQARREDEDDAQPREQSRRDDEPRRPRREKQADVIELNGDDDGNDSGLVETVENAPKPRKPRARKPKAKPVDDEASAAPEGDQPAAE